MIKICRIGVRKLSSTINGPVRYCEKNNCLHLSFHKFQAVNDDQKIIASFMHGQEFFFFRDSNRYQGYYGGKKIHLMRELQYIYPEQSEYSINIASNIRRKRKKIYEEMTHANIHVILRAKS